MRWAILSVIFVLTALPARAEVNGYRQCLDLVAQDPKRGLTEALAWRDLGGGPPALHCVALAHVANRDYRIAARKIEELAYIVENQNEKAAGEVMAQAGAVWLQANAEQEAERAYKKALTWRPDDARIRLDLAHVQAGQDRFDEALKNADKALELDDLSADAYALRGMVLRRLNRIAESDEATSTALALDPAQPQARMEQALAMARGGDMGAARQALTAIIQDHPEGDIAETAQQMLQRLERQ